MERTYKIVKKDREGLDAVRRPTLQDIAWAAGIYEGEGSCVLAGNKNKSFAVVVSQKDPELLYKLRDLFGGSVRLFNIKSRKRFLIYHWRICGNRARTFIGAVYPYLTARRKMQIDVTPLAAFLNLAQDLMGFDSVMGESRIYDSLWKRIGEYDAQQREKAFEHRQQYLREFEAKRSADSAYKERRRLQRQQRRNLKKAQNESDGVDEKPQSSAVVISIKKTA